MGVSRASQSEFGVQVIGDLPRLPRKAVHESQDSDVTFCHYDSGGFCIVGVF